MSLLFIHSRTRFMIFTWVFECDIIKKRKEIQLLFLSQKNKPSARLVGYIWRLDANGRSRKLETLTSSRDFGGCSQSKY
jgi:hypothetical protein